MFNPNIKKENTSETSTTFTKTKNTPYGTTTTELEEIKDNDSIDMVYHIKPIKFTDELRTHSKSPPTKQTTNYLRKFNEPKGKNFKIQTVPLTSHGTEPEFKPPITATVTDIVPTFEDIIDIKGMIQSSDKKVQNIQQAADKVHDINPKNNIQKNIGNKENKIKKETKSTNNALQTIPEQPQDPPKPTFSLFAPTTVDFRPPVKKEQKPVQLIQPINKLHSKSNNMHATKNKNPKLKQLDKYQTPLALTTLLKPTKKDKDTFRMQTQDKQIKQELINKFNPVKWKNQPKPRITFQQYEFPSLDPPPLEPDSQTSQSNPHQQTGNTPMITTRSHTKMDTSVTQSHKTETQETQTLNHETPQIKNPFSQDIRNPTIKMEKPPRYPSIQPSQPPRYQQLPDNRRLPTNRNPQQAIPTIPVNVYDSNDSVIKMYNQSLQRPVLLQTPTTRRTRIHTEARIRQKESTIRKYYQHQLDQSNKMKKNLQNQFNSTHQELQQKIQVIDKLNNDLSRANVKANEAEKLKHSNTILNQRLNQLSSTHQSLQIQHKKLLQTTNAKILQLEKDAEILKQENYDYLHQINTYKLDINKLEDAQTNTTYDYNNKIIQFKNQIHKLEISNKSLNSKMTDLQKLKNQLQQDKETLHKKVIQKDDDVNDYFILNDNLKTSLASVRSKLQTSQQQYQKLLEEKQKNYKFDKVIPTLNLQIQKLNNLNTKLRIDLADLQTKFKIAKRTFEHKVNQYTETFQTKTNDLAQNHNNQLSQLKQEYDDTTQLQVKYNQTLIDTLNERLEKAKDTQQQNLKNIEILQKKVTTYQIAEKQLIQQHQLGYRLVPYKHFEYYRQYYLAKENMKHLKVKEEIEQKTAELPTIPVKVKPDPFQLVKSDPLRPIKQESKGLVQIRG